MILPKINRREFLVKSAAIAATAATGGSSAAMSQVKNISRYITTRPAKNRKSIIVLFGGGTRYSESIGDTHHRYIPHLWNDLLPKGTLFTNMRVEHRVVHPNSAGSIMTGHWEWDDLEWDKPVKNPTIFEIYRKAYKTADTKTWAFVYASILSKTGVSLTDGFGSSFAANVVEPPTIPRTTAEQIEILMTDAVASGSVEAQLAASGKCQELAKKTSRISITGLCSKKAQLFLNKEYNQWKISSASTSHDTFLAERAINCMKEFSPDLIAVDFGEIDCAHYGSWSRYVDAIRQTDELTFKIMQAAEHMDDYKDNTLFLILPDHGRELDGPGHSGFIHHSNFYTNDDADEGCRRVWMLALGPGLKQARTIDRPVPITSAAATVLEFLNLEASSGAERSVLNLMI